MSLDPHIARRLSHVGVILVFAAIAAVQNGPRPTADARVIEPSTRPIDDASVRWASLTRALGRDGAADGGALRFDFPRSDVIVHVGADTLAPALALTSSMSFVPDGPNDVIAVGEIVLRRDEEASALAEARRQGMTVVAVDDALTGETPRMTHAALTARGDAASVGAKLHAVLAATATPLGHDATSVAPIEKAVDWSALDAILGAHDTATGPVATYSFRRRRGGAASRAVFEQLGGGRAAVTGAVHVLATEREAVVHALGVHGLRVTAVHAHLPNDAPTRVWVHWFAIGDATTLARGIAAALASTSR